MKIYFIIIQCYCYQSNQQINKSKEQSNKVWKTCKFYEWKEKKWVN